MELPLAARHQLHGLQPVLPVADVRAAAAWFVEVLGFDLDFLWGEPPSHARVKIGTLGPEGWGAPIYIHLSASHGPVKPCGELRLHVGQALDELYEIYRQRGCRLLMAPTTQPWGLREFSLATPDGHELRFGAEAP